MSSYWSRYDDAQSNNGAEHDRSETRIARVRRPIYHRTGEDGELYPWRLFEERVRTGPFGLSRFPLQPFSPVRILILNGGSGDSNTNSRINGTDSINPRLRRFIQNSPPRIRNEWNVWIPPELQELEDPGLTESEFKTAMRRLKKQVYQPSKRTQRRGLFGSTRSMTKNEVEVERTGEGGGKECTICLEAFVPNEHVLVTPCKHMFHKGCITPWVKSHGKCPICRFAFCERTQSGRMLPNYNDNNDNNNNNNNANVNNNGNRRVISTAGRAEMTGEEEALALELFALIRAMEEAFNWITSNSRAIPFE